MTLPRPPWEFRDQRDKKKFKAWLIEQLDASYEPSEDDIWREAQNDETYADEVARDLGRRLKRGKVMLAAEAMDREALRRLTADDLSLKDIALAVLTHKHIQGREHGDARPRDLTDVERSVLEDALDELERIRRIMKHHYNRVADYDDLAIEVARERAGIKQQSLRSYRKSRPGKKRLKSPI